VKGESAASKIDRFEASDLACQVYAPIPLGDGENGTYNPGKYLEPKEQRKVDDFIIYAIAAADEAIQDAGWQAKSDEDSFRAGVLIGSGIGGLQGIEKNSLLFNEKGPRRISPFFIPGRLINLASGHVSIRHGLKGPNSAVVTACSTGSHAIGDAARMIALDDADMMVAGGSESPLCRLSIAGFSACKALTTHFNDAPEKASRPYDVDRDGFLMGEGAGIVVMEEYERAVARGAHIYAEVIGYGLSGDAFHITAPAEDGSGAYRCMEAALKRANLKPADIDYINAHGTSTPMGDEIELGAVERLFGDAAGDLVMSSTKSAIGHLLGAAGAVESIFSVLSIEHNYAPPTLNLDNPSVETKINLCPHKGVEKDIDVVLSNSFGFGGTNASLVFRSVN
jgi:3-oxoacyl-[acyl-carrier-protein] synthase II